MLQKIVRIGNSAGLIIPKNLITQMNLGVGDQVDLEFDSDAEMLLLGKQGQVASKSADRKFLNVLDEVNEQYGPALKKLAKQ
jgi:putative addiction module antidote